MKSISLQHTDEADCCKGKMQKKGCCKEKTAFIKVKDTQAAAKTLQLPSQKTLVLFTFAYQFVTDLRLQPSTPVVHADREPPDLYYPPDYLRHRVLLI